MKKTNLTKLILISIILLALGFFGYMLYNKLTSEATYSSATIYITMGSAKTSTDGITWQEAEDGEDYPQGTYIKTETASRAILIFPDNSITRLDEDTKIQIQTINIDAQNTQINLFLETGRIWSRVIEFVTEDNSDFSVETSDSVAMVRGTVFGAEANTDNAQNRSLFYTIKSRIKLIDKVSQNQIDVDEGYYSNEVADGQIVKSEIPDDWYQKDWFRYAMQHDADLDTFFQGKDARKRLYLRNSFRFIKFRQFVFNSQTEEDLSQRTPEYTDTDSSVEDYNNVETPIVIPQVPFITITNPTSTPCSLNGSPITGTIGNINGILRPEVILTITQKGLYWNGQTFSAQPSTVIPSFGYDGLSWTYQMPDYSYIEIKAELYGYKNGTKSLLSTSICE